MPWIDYRDLCHRLDIIEVLAWMDWHANAQRGEFLRGNCPLCGKAESRQGREFSVHRPRKLFYCFRCKQGGNLLDLWSRYHQVDLTTAAHELNKILRDPPTSRSSNPESPPHRPQT